MIYTENFLRDSQNILQKVNKENISMIVSEIKRVKSNNGRIFFLGVGGSAANASHAVNDFRKIANIECYCPSDNVSELTARTNDDGFSTVFNKYLEISQLKENDAIFILSVGGGNKEKNISTNLIEAIDYAKSVKAKILGIVSRDGGYTLQNANACVLVPIINVDTTTPQAESIQSLLLHLLVSHPEIASNKAKWEGLKLTCLKTLKANE